MNYHVRFRGLPLTVYREVAAHLGQLEGVQVELVPQQAHQFAYTDSQIESLWIRYPDSPSPEIAARLEQILAYYGDRYGGLETMAS